jgi:phosphoglycerol transferase MdoB-like AlkP superfamily enzyme
MRSQPIVLIIKHLLFFLAVFALGRLVFLLYNFQEIQSAPILEWFKTFVWALYLDFSTLSYVIILLSILYAIFIFSGNNTVLRIIRFLSAVIVIQYFTIVVSELMIYKEWRTKLSFRAISFLSNISEVFHVVSMSQLLLGLSAVILLSTICIYVQNKWFLKASVALHQPHFLLSALYTLILFAIVPIGIRGGLQPIPIIQSDVYFSNNNTLNLAAVNSIWNLGQSIWENRHAGSKNPYLFFDNASHARLMAELKDTAPDSSLLVFSNNRPNIVLITLESWSANIIGALNGPDSVALQMSALARKGIRFTKCYSPGRLSDEGHVSILSGFPAQPLTILTSQPQKYHGLSFLAETLKQNGYSTTYMYNGDLSYGNIKSYVMASGFEKIYDKDNVENKTWKQGRLGYQDNHLFERLSEIIPQCKAPFFVNAFTLTTHNPYDFEGEKKIKNKGEFSDYLSSIVYVDSVIGKFIEMAKKQSWYSNTVFVFLSDHSHPTPSNSNHFLAGDRRMVAFMFGDAIKKEYCGKTVNYPVNQQDFASTIVKQLGIASPFKYGKDVFNPYAPHYAYFSFDHGFGFVQDSGAYVYDLRDKKVIESTFKNPRLALKADSLGRAYLQSIFTDYLSY